jgi:hypothetical protein
MGVDGVIRHYHFVNAGNRSCLSGNAVDITAGNKHVYVATNSRCSRQGDTGCGLEFRIIVFCYN